jgi:four helix bundle protein
MEIVDLVYSFLETMPKDERFNLITQMAKSSVSIPSNIAEGAGRKSDKEFRRFLEISLGSAYELETQMLVAQRREMGNQQMIPNILDKIALEQRKLGGFMQKLN